MTRVAVIGCGYWGKNIIRNLYSMGVLTWVCDTNTERVQEVAGKYSVFGSNILTPILGYRQVDAVVVATPATTHYQVASQVLASGKHVFVEKPLALSLEEGNALVRMAKKRNLILMVGHVLEYHPGVRRLYEIVNSGQLGELLYVYSNRLNLGKVRMEENILWSFAPHDISVITSLTGHMPVSVAATGQDYLQNGLPDVTVTNMRFSGKLRAHIFVSWIHPYKEQRLVVVGRKKMAALDDVEKTLKVYDKNIEWDHGQPVPVDRAETQVFFSDEEPLRKELEHFIDCVQSGREPITSGSQGVKVLKILTACQQSLELGGDYVEL